MVTLKRTASGGHAWLLLLLLLPCIIIIIISVVIGRLASRMTGIAEQQHPRTDRFFGVADALEASQHRSSNTLLHLLSSFRLHV